MSITILLLLLVSLLDATDCRKSHNEISDYRYIHSTTHNNHTTTDYEHYHNGKLVDELHTINLYEKYEHHHHHHHHHNSHRHEHIEYNKHKHSDRHSHSHSHSDSDEYSDSINQREADSYDADYTDHNIYSNEKDDRTGTHYESQHNNHIQHNPIPLLYKKTKQNYPDVSKLPLYGLAYSSPLAHDNNCPTMHQTFVELSLVRQYTQRIRIYSTLQCNLIDILTAAQHLNMTVLLTMYITTQNEWNVPNPDISFGREKAALLQLLDTHHELIYNTVDGIIVGSECMLRNELTATQLTNYVLDIKDTVFYKHFPYLQITVADAYSEYLNTSRHDIRRLINAVDYISIHIHPYYEQIAIDNAVEHIDNALYNLTKLVDNPRKQIVITETGWPTDGLNNGKSIANPINAYKFYNNFVCYATKYNIKYYYFEAFDESWKANDHTTNKQGDVFNVESHFGFLYESDHQLKWPFENLDVDCNSHSKY